MDIRKTMRAWKLNESKYAIKLIIIIIIKLEAKWFNHEQADIKEKSSMIRLHLYTL
jgi:hypothetical protein